MDLILKPTSQCNFRCAFCSSTKLSDESKDRLDLTLVGRFLDRYPHTRTIILNGGDPLMLPPSYYITILQMLADRGMYETILSFTTNLWPFYKQPSKWLGIFKHPQVGVCTSFQYGNKRLKGDGTVYTEKEFWDVSDLCLKMLGYRPSFIAVIDESNRDMALDTVKLAREMGVVCKLNYANSSGPVTVVHGISMGNEGSHYLLADAYEMYLEIYHEGLMAWEHNTQQMIQTIQGEDTICPVNRHCDSNIRVLQPDGGYYSCGAFGDDRLYSIDFESEMSGRTTQPLKVYDLDSMKKACYSCPMFLLCNGCRKTIHDTKTSSRVEEHCYKMKTIAQEILVASNMVEYLEITPYEDERCVIPTIELKH